MHVTNITLEKKNSKGSLSAATKHNERKGNEKDLPSHVDTRRCHLNETVVGPEHLNLYNEIANRITGKNLSESVTDRMKKSDLHYADGKKVYDNAVLAFEAVMQYPGDLVWSKLNKLGEPCRVEGLEEITDIKVDDVRADEHADKGYFLWPKNMREYQEWVKTSVEFLQDKFGANNILQAKTHMDESVPHIHVIGVPIYENDKGIEKLSYTRFGVDGAKELSQLQTEYADSLKHLGYQRGEEFSTRIDYSTHYQFRAREAASLDAELPKDPVKAKEVYKDAIVQLEAAKMEIEKIHATGKVVSKLRKREQELKDEIKAKDATIEDQTQRIRQLEIENWRRECELKGMQLHPDQSMMNNVYGKLQEQLIDLGERYYESVGVRAATLEKDSPERIHKAPIELENDGRNS